MKYARTSKGLFCMSCHEKLLAKKKKYQKQKLQEAKNRISHLSSLSSLSIDKHLPDIPSGFNNKLQHTAQLSPQKEEDASQESTINIPQRSPNRPTSPNTYSNLHSIDNSLESKPLQISPLVNKQQIEYAEKDEPAKPEEDEEHYEEAYENFVSSNDNLLSSFDELKVVSSLKPPVDIATNSISFPSTDANDNNSQEVLKTPTKASPQLNIKILSPQAENRKAVIVDNYSINSSPRTFLSEYVSREHSSSPPPRVRPPNPPSGGGLTHSNNSLHSLHKDTQSQQNIENAHKKEKKLREEDDDYIDMDSSDSERDVKIDEQQQQTLPENEVNLNGLNIYEDNHPFTEPTKHQDQSHQKQLQQLQYHQQQLQQQQILQSQPLQQQPLIFNQQQLSPNASVSRSKSFKSPKSFLSFKKHEKTNSSSSNHKRSSINEENNNGFNLNNILKTPNLNHQHKKSESSPYQGAALFTTPPVPQYNDKKPVSYATTESEDSKKKSHIRSSSDINTIKTNFDFNNLEIRALHTEILNLKQTKQQLKIEVNELLNLKNNLNNDIHGLNNKIKELKSEIENFNSNPEVEKSETKPKTRFWKRSAKNINNVFVSNSTPAVTSTPNSNSTPSLAQSNMNILNNTSGGDTESEELRISAPVLVNEEVDELGGNDNQKLISKSNLIEIDNSNNNNNINNNNSSIRIHKNFDLLNSNLDERALFEKRSIPLIITRLIKEVELRGLEQEGIYRKNGATSQINGILKAFNNLILAETSSELENSLKGDINGITSALKKYLYYHLPEPIITFKVYDSFINIINLKTKQERVKQFNKLLLNLPITNLITLKFILKHIKKIESFKDENKMNFHNLSVVFAPTFTRVQSTERELIDMKARNFATEFLLTYQDEIFNYK